MELITIWLEEENFDHEYEPMANLDENLILEEKSLLKVNIIMNSIWI